MKLATYIDGSRDGQLVVVSRDLATAHYASSIAQRVQQVLDDWNFMSPQLEDLYQTLNHGKARHAFPFEPRQCLAPLPRAFQWAAPTRAAKLAHRASDHFAGPSAAIDVAGLDAPEVAFDFGPGVAAATGDIRAGSDAAVARDGVRLLLLACDWWRLPAGIEDGWSDSAPAPFATSFGPVAVTPDEAAGSGDGWREDRLQLTLSVQLNGQKFARLGLAELSLARRFGELLAELAASRDVRAGSLIGSGPLEGVDGGFSNIAGKRAAQFGRDGQRSAAFLQAADGVRIEVIGPGGQSLFGPIEQAVTAAA